MSDYWDLFAETGDIGFYLLYLKSAEKNCAAGTKRNSRHNERQKAIDLLI
jgi:hypothetical protein